MAEKTTITTVSVTVQHEMDLGYVPFMTQIVKKYGAKNIPFGMRDASRAKLDVRMTAELGSDDTVEEVATKLIQQANAIVDRELRLQYPESFRDAVKAGLPEQTIVTRRTEVNEEMVEIAPTTLEPVQGDFQ